MTSTEIGEDQAAGPVHIGVLLLPTWVPKVQGTGTGGHSLFEGVVRMSTALHHYQIDTQPSAGFFHDDCKCMDSQSAEYTGFDFSHLSMCDDC